MTNSDTKVILPLEIILLILEWLVDHPVQLYLCGLVCRAWYFASQGDLDWSTSMEIENGDDLSRLAYIVTSPYNARFGRLVKRMSVIDDAAKPFAHSVPIRLPGYRFPNLQHLEFINLNWSTTRPHPIFFPCFSCFSYLTLLELAWSRFRRPDDLWNMLAASTNLEELRLRAVTVQSDWFGSHAPAPDRPRQLRTLTVGEPDPPLPAPPFQRNEALTKRYDRDVPLVLPASVIDVLALQATLTSLSLVLSRFSSFSHVDRLIRALPALTSIEALHDPSWVFPRVRRASSLFAPPTDSQSARTWAKLILSSMSSSTTLGFLASFISEERSRGVRKLSITLNESPSPSLRLVVSALLERCGPTLEDFGWQPGVYAASALDEVRGAGLLQYVTPLMTSHSIPRPPFPHLSTTSLCSEYTHDSSSHRPASYPGCTTYSCRCSPTSQARVCNKSSSSSTRRMTPTLHLGLGILTAYH